jgi:hypothetical protein
MPWPTGGARRPARLRGQFAGLLGLPAQLAKRRVIQPHRQVEDGEIARALVEVIWDDQGEGVITTPSHPLILSPKSLHIKKEARTMPMPAPQEQLGSFYLGAEYDLAGGARKDDSPIHYDARDLVTHAVCVGMTGSGKTGLCIGLLEEAALDKVPGILIDPKGDITNLLLQFPDCSPEDFAPWINAHDARARRRRWRSSPPPPPNWQKGLADWGIGGDRMRKLASMKSATRSSRPVRTWACRSTSWAAWPRRSSIGRASGGDPRAHQGTVAALLGLAGVNADPVRSREGILLSTIFEHFWQQGQNPRPGQTDQPIQQPPVRQMGVFEVDTFFPEKDRFGLAMAFNTLVASPKFQVWLQGEPLDVERCSTTPTASRATA